MYNLISLISSFKKHLNLAAIKTKTHKSIQILFLLQIILVINLIKYTNKHRLSLKLQAAQVVVKEIALIINPIKTIN